MATFAVVRFPGSNCDDDALYVFDTLLAAHGARAKLFWHKETELGEVDFVILPGGFSFGDYLRAGALAAHSPIMSAVKRFADNGGPVLGICNGFQVLCESGLLPGALGRNQSLKFVCHDVYCRVEGKPTPFTKALPAGRHIKMSTAHAEGRYMHPDIEALEKSGQVIFRYVSEEGIEPPRPAAVRSAGAATQPVAGLAQAALHHEHPINPSGSLHNIAGICNPAGNVVGLMPHPERACETILAGKTTDGLQLFMSALASKTGHPARIGALS